jgi:hypothetical protein
MGFRKRSCNLFRDDSFARMRGYPSRRARAPKSARRRGRQISPAGGKRAELFTRGYIRNPQKTTKPIKHLAQPINKNPN